LTVWCRCSKACQSVVLAAKRVWPEGKTMECQRENRTQYWATDNKRGLSELYSYRAQPPTLTERVATWGLK